MKQYRKFLIIGGTSYIGKYLCNKIDSKDYISTSKEITQDHYKFNIKSDNLKKLYKNYTFEYAIILIGETNPDLCANFQKDTYYINVVKIKKLLKSFKKNNIKPIFFSSESVYDGVTGNYLEKDKINPILEYGKQKIEIENFIISRFKNFIIFRLAKVISNTLDKNNLLYNWLNSLLNHNNINVAYDQKSNFINIDDVVNCTIKAIKRNISGVYNLGGKHSYTKEKLLYSLQYFLNDIFISRSKINKVSIDSFKTIEKRPKNISLNSNKIYKLLNYNPNNIDRVLEDIIYKWYRKYYDNEIINLNSKIAYTQDQNAKSPAWYSNFKMTTFNTKVKNQLLDKINLLSVPSLRLCLHNHSNDNLHDMIIIKKKNTYYKPKYHTNKNKIFTIIKGSLAVFIYNALGQILYYYILKKGSTNIVVVPQYLFHSDLPLTDVVLYRETTTGPLDLKDHYEAKWAPNNKDHKSKKFIDFLYKSMKGNSINEIYTNI